MGSVMASPGGLRGVGVLEGLNSSMFQRISWRIDGPAGKVED
jgi:hypothetical protein